MAAAAVHKKWKMDIKSLAKTQPLSTLSVFSYIPPRRTGPKEQSFFNSESKVLKEKEIFIYDQLHRRTEGYDNKSHRDDRRHAKGRGLDIQGEESSRPVAVLSSSEYGRRPPPLIYKPDSQFFRAGHIRAEFLRKNGIVWTFEEGYGSVVPV